MNKITFVLAAALSVAAFGCKKKSGADCGKAITNSMAVSKADMSKMPGVDDKMMAKMTEIGMQRCKEDKWADDVVRCMSDAKTQVDAQACYGKMTAEQRAKMEKAVMETVMPAGAGAGAGAAGSADMGSAAAGSDTGSATAGSAAGSGSAEAAGSAAGSGSAAAGDTGSGSAGSAAAPK
jgi:hypothetical protein